jgi:hypothetical protein
MDLQQAADPATPVGVWLQTEWERIAAATLAQMAAPPPDSAVVVDVLWPAVLGILDGYAETAARSVAQIVPVVSRMSTSAAAYSQALRVAADRIRLERP